MIKARPAEIDELKSEIGRVLMARLIEENLPPLVMASALVVGVPIWTAKLIMQGAYIEDGMIKMPGCDTITITGQAH